MELRCQPVLKIQVCKMCKQLSPSRRDIDFISVRIFRSVRYPWNTKFRQRECLTSRNREFEPFFSISHNRTGIHAIFECSVGSRTERKIRTLHEIHCTVVSVRKMITCVYICGLLHAVRPDKTAMRCYVRLSQATVWISFPILPVSGENGDPKSGTPGPQFHGKSGTRFHMRMGTWGPLREDREKFHYCMWQWSKDVCGTSIP